MDKKYFHGSNNIVQKPNLKHSRTDIDFGRGFYLTEDNNLANKWACGKNGNSFLNEYHLDMHGLNIKKLSLDKEWLHYVAGNRTKRPQDYSLYFDDSDYDVIIGPIADDNLFSTIDLYLDGFISATKAVKILNVMEYGEQIVLKTEKALSKLQFFSAKELSETEQRKYTKLYADDKIIKKEKTYSAMKEIPDIWRD